MGQAITIDFEQISLSATQTFTANRNETSGSITIRSAIENNGFDLSITGSSNKAVYGVISGTGGVHVIDSSDTWFNVPHTYTGATQITSSIVGLQLDGRLGDATNATHLSNATLVVSGITNNEDITMTGSFSSLRIRNGGEQAGDVHVATTNQTIIEYAASSGFGVLEWQHHGRRTEFRSAGVHPDGCYTRLFRREFIRRSDEGIRWR